MATIDKDTTIILLNETGILPLFYHADIDIAKKVLMASYQGGA